MKSKELRNLGITDPEIRLLAVELIRKAAKHGLSAEAIRDRVRKVASDPQATLGCERFGELAQALIEKPPVVFEPKDAPWQQWGDDLEPDAVRQMTDACQLPITVRGALMPDAHVGYGLPIGGVLATHNAVIPYAVGVDIACRMRLTVFDMPAKSIRTDAAFLSKVLERETVFGVGAGQRDPTDHPVMEMDWDVSPITRQNRDKAWKQLGTSGSGNHFVEFGELTLDQPDLGLEAGVYLAVMSHSGSRGTGALVCQHYSRLAMQERKELPDNLKRLAWLDLDTDAGREYWMAMELMGRYAHANHELIHKRIERALKAKAMACIENHHNFAWKEIHDGQEVIVHRKGATPAGRGVLGVIPGSMASPAFVVRGKGHEGSLLSASHGAGRRMSRTKANNTLRWSDVKKMLAERGVTLLSAGLDEAPDVYKDIHTVMAHQHNLIDVVARFDPRIVKMCPAGERPED
ncbi:MAG: RtcB family protein [Armatimonadetes bacterium]|nr:RtcB family protein [Armatimonadota bacterium]